jgi:hypothetical protein
MDRSLQQNVTPTLAVETRLTGARRGRRLRSLIMLLLDLALIFAGFRYAYWLRYQADWPEPFDRIVFGWPPRTWCPSRPSCCRRSSL